MLVGALYGGMHMSNQSSCNHGFRISLEKDAHNNPIKDENGNYQCQFTFYVRAPRFRVIVFKGGGGRAWVYRKLLHIMEDNGSLHYIKEYGGSSAGALYAALAAIPMKAQEREFIIDELKFHRDILSNTRQAKLYKILTAPLYLISKPLEWIAKISDVTANFFNKISFGNILGWPLHFIAGLFKISSAITHPEFAAGIYNLFSKGGIYKGNNLQEYIRQSIYASTKKSLEQFLNNLDNISQKRRAINALKRIPYLIKTINEDPNADIKIELCNKEITFEHFHLLSKIKGLGFRDIFLTGTRCREVFGKSRLRVFNYKNDPQKPVYRAVRISMSAPLIYQSVRDDDGMEYMDGGCADNFPMEHASERQYPTQFEKKYLRGQYKQDLDVLGVRVEYEKDLGILFEPIRILQGWWEKLTNTIEQFIYNKICGMDIYKTENDSRNIFKEKFSHRVLQLYDHGVGFTEVDIAAPRKHRILQIEEKRINDFMKAHRSELTHAETYTTLYKKKKEIAEKKNMSKKNLQPKNKLMNKEMQKKTIKIFTR